LNLSIILPKNELFTFAFDSFYKLNCYIFAIE